MYTLAALVTTTREHLANQTNRLVDAATAFDKSTVNDLLHPTVTLAGPDGDTWLDAPTIRDQLETIQDRNLIESQTITAMRAHAESPSTGRTLLTVRTTARTDLGQRGCAERG